MAPVTAITDVVDPEILADMIVERLPDNTILVPGVYTSSEFAIPEKGTKWDIPYDKPLGDYETFIAGTPLTPQKFEQDKYAQVVIRKAAAYAADKVIRLGAARDPMASFADRAAEKTMEMYFKMMLIISTASSIAAGNMIAGGSAISLVAVRAAKAKLGDKAQTLKYIIMHSVQFDTLNAAGAIIYQPENAMYPIQVAATVHTITDVKNPGLVPTVAGLRVFVSDLVELICSNYHAILLGDEALDNYWQQQMNVDLDYEVLEKESIISPDVDFVMVAHGVNYDATSYTDVELGKNANYTLKWDSKLVKVVSLPTTS